MITDGHSFAVRAQDASTSTTRLVGPDRCRLTNKDKPDSLTYQIINTDTANRWRPTTTFVTHPSRPTLLIAAEFTSLHRQPYQVYAVYQPQLNNHAAHCPRHQSNPN